MRKKHLAWNKNVISITNRKRFPFTNLKIEKNVKIWVFHKRDSASSICHQGIRLEIFLAVFFVVEYCGEEEWTIICMTKGLFFINLNIQIQNYLIGSHMMTCVSMNKLKNSVILNLD